MDPLIDLALLLFGAKLGGIAFSRLKQPSIVGELLSGIVIGPSILNIVRVSNLVTSVSNLGLLFLILLVSLTIDWKSIEKSTEKFVFVEFTRLFITMGMVYLLGIFFGWNTYTFLVMAFIIMLSSTAIVSRTLADMRELSTPHGQTLMGLEVVDEVVAIVSVAILANVLSGGSFTPVPLATTIFVVVGMFVVMGRVGFRFVNRLTSSIQRYGIEEALLGFTLLLAFLLGGLTESLNLASVLGVFLAGMILSRSAQSVLISRKVKDIGESFFIPIFFASVGLTINIFSAFDQAWFIAALIASVLAIKFLSSMTSLKIFRYSDQESLVISSGFVTLSEMTIVIVAIAATSISQTLYVSIIAAFVIINTISPVIMSASISRGSRFSLARAGAIRRFALKASAKTSKKRGSYSYRPGR